MVVENPLASNPNLVNVNDLRAQYAANPGQFWGAPYDTNPEYDYGTGGFPGSNSWTNPVDQYPVYRSPNDMGGFLQIGDGGFGAGVPDTGSFNFDPFTGLPTGGNNFTSTPTNGSSSGSTNPLGIDLGNIDVPGFGTMSIDDILGPILNGGFGTQSSDPQAQAKSKAGLAAILGRIVSGKLPGVANTAGNLFGALTALQQQNWLNGGKVNVLNNLNGVSQEAQKQIGNYSPAFNYLGGEAAQGAQDYNNRSGGAAGWDAQLLNNDVLGQFRSMTDPNSIPGMSGALGTSNAMKSYLGNLIGGVTGNLGTDPSTQSGILAALGLGQGNNAGIQSMFKGGDALMQQGLNNPYANFLQGAAGNSIANGGYTPQLNAINQQGLNLMQMNPSVAQAMGVAGGILGKNPLLSMDQVVSMARNENATQSKNQETALKRQLMDRTGVTGPAVAGGGQNELLNQLGNQALQNQSSAVTNAMMQQQALQEQLFGQGAGLFGTANAANQGYTGQGLNAQLGAGQQAGNLQQILGNLGVSGGTMATNQAATGGNLLAGGLGAQTAGLNALSGLGNTANSAYLGKLGAINNLAGTTNTTNDQLIKAFMDTQGLGLAQNGAGYKAINDVIGNLTTLGGQGIAMQNSSLNPLSQILGQWIQEYGGANTAQTGLFGTATPQNYFQNIITPQRNN